MKQARHIIFILLTALIAVGVRAQTKNRLVIADITAKIGQVQLPVSIENTDEIVGAQFDLTLPTGVTAEAIGTISNRGNGHQVTVRQMTGQRFRVMLYSPENKPLRGQSGVVMYIPITIPDTYTEGSEHQLSISENCVLSDVKTENVLTEVSVGKIILSKLPDLTVRSITSDRQTLTPGDKVVVSWQVENIGNEGTNGGWSEQLALVSANGYTQKLMATTYCNETLEANGLLSRQAEVVVPSLLGIEGEARIQVRIISDNQTGESTAATGNNTVVSDEILSVNKRLFVEPLIPNIVENKNGRVGIKISRSGDWNSEQTFTLSTTADTRISLPANVTIQAGQSGAVVYMTIHDNNVLDPNSEIIITAEGHGYPEATGQIVIEDNEYPDIILTTTESQVSEGDTFQMTVTLGRLSNQPVVVTLTSETAKRFNFPSQVTIPAGELSATVDVTVVDDDLPSLQLSNAFTASATGYNNGETIVILDDDDIPALELTLTPNRVSESAGVTAVAGVLRRTGKTNNKITVKLTDNAGSKLYFGNRTLELAKGVEEIHFNFGPVDNTLVDGDRTYTITAAVWVSSCNCSAAGESAGSVSAQLEVFDDDGPSLGLTSSLSTVKEGGQTTLTITRNTATNNALTLSLSSDYDDNLTYNHTVVIPAGQSSATVEVTSKPNDVSGDSHTVIFTATAEGYSSGTCYVMVTDQTLPDARISSLTANKTETMVGDEVNLTMVVTNEGTAVLPAGVTVKIYRYGSSAVISTLYTNNSINIGGKETLTKTIVLPTTVSDHRYYAVINESHGVIELLYNNNTSPEAIISAIAPFTVSVNTNKNIYQQGEKVIISGQLTGRNTANTDIDVYLINEGSRQVNTVMTNSQGSFSYEWELYALQSGHFSVGACYPNENQNTEMASFDVYGIKRTNNNHITCETLVGEPFNGGIQLQNPSSLSLSNVHVEVIEKPKHISADFGVISSMSGGDRKTLSFTLNSDDLSPANEWEEVKIRILANEGPNMDLTLYYHNSSPRASLSTNISKINTTMQMSGSCDYVFSITNNGKGDTGRIILGLPSWMKSATSSTISSLGYGESTQIFLTFTPNTEMQLNVPLTGQISINCENGDGIALPYFIKPVSDSNGTMVVDVTDEYTYYAEGKPHVANARVEIRQPVTNEIVLEGNTNADGIFSAELPAGYYSVIVTANNHDSYSNSIMVAPGTETPVDVFISFQAITYSWNVVETEVEDKYEIETIVKYETRVPAPVVVVNFPEEIPYQSQILNIIATNKGLLSAYNVVVDLPTDREDATFEVLTSLPIDTLKPQTSVVIPIKMTVTGNTSYESQGSVTYGGTYYGEIGSNQPSSQTNTSRTRSSAEEISPGCWRITLTVAHDHRVCNKNTGEWEPAGTTYTSRSYNYGNCGGGGPGLGGGGGLPPMWGGGGGPGGPQGPHGPGPNQTTHHNNNNNQQHTQTYDGCTTYCEDAAVSAAASCAAAASGCVLGEAGPVGWALACVGSLAAGCHSVNNAWTAIDCILGGLGCIPGIAGCAFSTAGCAKAIYDEYHACDMTNFSSRKNARSNIISKSISKENYEGIRLIYLVDSLSLEKVLTILGLGEWDYVTGEEFIKIQDYLWKNMSETSVCITEDRYQYKPAAFSEADFDKFLYRLDNSLKKEKDPTLVFDNVIDLDVIEDLEDKITSVEAEIQELGYKGIQELNDSVVSHYKYLMKRAEEGSSNSVCATVTIKISQEMVMTRQAFRGTLTVFNGNETTAMTDVKLNMNVTSSDGIVATAHEFQINAESLDGFTGELDLTSGWTLAANGTGTATILFIPTKYAAPTEPVEWSFGGTLSYVDPFTGLEVTRELFPVTLTVKPSPELDLTYFMQRDIYGDDALTLDKVEPMVPAEFALLINNKGNGDATNVRMVTQQPEIIENEKGLYIDFEIVSSQVNGGEANLAFGKSIANDFGTIPAHSQAYAQWWLTSTLLGHFTEYDVQANHVTSYGNEDLSLLGDVTIHELIHSLDLSTSNQKMIGFLVNDIADAEDMPDMLYLSNGEVTEVSMATSCQISKVSDTTFRLTVTPSAAGWTYGNLIDPSAGMATIKSIRRQSDGKEINLRNFWQTDRTLRDGRDPLYECRIHFADEFASQSTETYLLTFDPVPDVVLAVEQIDGVPEEGTVAFDPVNLLTVKFNKAIKAETFTADDLTFAVQGVKQDAKQIGISTTDNESFTLDLEALTTQCSNGYYTMTVQTAGMTDEEGFKGKDGKQVGWILFRGGLVQLLTSAWPENSGTVSRKPLETAGTRARGEQPADNSAEYGSTVVLLATPSEGYEFSNWTMNGEVVSNSPEFETKALGDMDVVANFTKKSYLVNVEAESEGGSVTGMGSGYYEYQTRLELTAVPSEDFMFKNWIVNGQFLDNNSSSINIPVDKILEVKAEFVREYYQQSLSLAKGWNWISSYLSEHQSIADLARFASRIVSQTDELLNDPKYGMVGTISELEAGRAYKVQASRMFNSSYRGHLYNTATTPVSLHKGWNWVAYPYVERASVGSVIKNAEEGDYIASQTGFAEYSEHSWEGSLESLVPGEGYLYKSQTDKDLQFDFSGVANVRQTLMSRVHSLTEADIDIRRYPNTMNVTAQICRDGFKLSSDKYTVYAMTGNELRGISQCVGQNHYLTVYGESPIEVTFLIESVETGETFVAKEILAFRDEVVGSRKSPFLFNIGSATGIESIDGDHPMSVYNLQGILVSKDATLKTLRRLPKGVYIINGQKCFIK